MKKIPTSIRNYCGQCCETTDFTFLKSIEFMGLDEMVMFECSKCGQEFNLFRGGIKEHINYFNAWETCKKLEAKKEKVKKQDKIIHNQVDIMTFEELKKNKPTLQWIEDNEEDDEYFTEENISAINELLDTFINNLEKLGTKPTETKIMKAVKEVVIRINKLNEKYDDFIATMEREDLCMFIDTAARIAGLECEEDITEEWREW